MFEQEENEEKVTFTVTDRRKFNPDGTVKEGVVIEPEKKPSEAARTATASEKTQKGNERRLEESSAANSAATEESDLPGADDPASFVNFLSTLATNAAAALGAVPHPVTGQRTLDLDSGKFWIDVLAMLREKTKGNLLDKEARLLDGLLADLRMQYVTMVRATEEKLKAQAAKKFSGADILGKK